MGATRRAGFTLLEVIIASTILSVVVLAALSLFINTDESVGEALIITDTAQRANRLVIEFQRELGNGADFRLEDDHAQGKYTRIEYRKLVDGYDYVNGRANYSAVRRLRLRLDSGEAADGDDDDGDGLVDEGEVVLEADTDDDGTPDTVVSVVARDVPLGQLDIRFLGGANGATPSDDDTHILVTFDVRRRLLRAQGSAPARVHAERRQVRVVLRNRNI